MVVDVLLRNLLIGGVSLGAVLLLIGGLLTRVAGTWLDGHRRIILHQFGPFVTGLTSVRGGEERYSGLACFGHVRLSRRAYGAQLLKSIGFDERSIKTVSGSTTARLRLRLQGDALVGTFEGRKFSFSTDRSRLVGTSWVTPVKRSWRRDSAL